MYAIGSKNDIILIILHPVGYRYLYIYDFKSKLRKYRNIFSPRNNQIICIQDKKGASYDDMLSSDEEGHDAYLERMKAEGKQRNEDEEDEDSSEGNIFSIYIYILYWDHVAYNHAQIVCLSGKCDVEWCCLDYIGPISYGDKIIIC